MFAGSFYNMIHFQDVVDVADCSVEFGMVQSALVASSGEKCSQGMKKYFSFLPLKSVNKVCTPFQLCFKHVF